MVLLPLTFMVDPTMNLISEIHHECERREHHGIVLREYLIITTWIHTLRHCQRLRSQHVDCLAKLRFNIFAKKLKNGH